MLFRSSKIITVSYSNAHERKMLKACLRNWFSNPRDLQFTDPRMPYPFDFRKWCALSYQEENIKTFVINEEGWVVAYLSVKIIPENKQAHFFHLFVDKNHRRWGLAKKLLDHAINYAEDFNVNFITLNVVPKNERAIAVYKTAGFIEDGVTARGSIKMKKGLG